MFATVRKDLLDQDLEIPSRQGKTVPGKTAAGEVIVYKTLPGDMDSEGENPLDEFDAKIQAPDGTIYDVYDIDLDRKAPGMDLSLLFSKYVCREWKDKFNVTTVEEAIKIPRELAIKKMRDFGTAKYNKLAEAAKALKLDVIPAEHPKRISFRRNLISALNDTPFREKLSVQEKNEIVDHVLLVLAKNAESAESLFNPDLEEEKQVMAFPLPWLKV